jgi:hypothetical protein
MLALTTAAHSASQGSSAILFIIAAIAVAAFWKALIKIGLAVLVIGVLIVIFGGASAIISGLHGILP